MTVYVPDDVHDDVIGYRVIHTCRCEQCLAWQPPLTGTKGICRRHAPRGGQTTVTTTTWPRTVATDWCCESTPHPVAPAA